jgi:hypothetical protein
MAHGTEKHLEHAEHAQHHAHDPFDRPVAMTMAMVAAALACVSMLSHRAHNETLKLHIMANDAITEASDKWGYYQAKKNREYMFAADAALLAVIAKDSSRPDAAKQAEKQIADWKSKVDEYKNDTATIEHEARELGEKAKETDHEAEVIHHRANRLDSGQLGLELALVLCSIAVLTKQRGFWYSGIGVGVIGAIVALSAFFMH